MNNLKIGIVVADDDEYKTLKSYIEKGDFENHSFLGRMGHKFDVVTECGTANVVSILCGIGKVNAAAATAHLCDLGCDVILNYGLSGGISGVRRGDICLPCRFLEHDFDLTGIGYKPCEKPSQKYIYEASDSLIKLFSEILSDTKSGTAVTGDCFICDKSVSDSLKNTFGATSCDMETAAIAYICEFAKIPFLSIRRISDDAGDDALSSYREMNTSNETVLSDLVIDFCKVLIKNGQAIWIRKL